MNQNRGLVHFHNIIVVMNNRVCVLQNYSILSITFLHWPVDKPIPSWNY